MRIRWFTHRRFRRINWLNIVGVVAIVLAATAIVLKNLPARESNEILNVSYDPTRELYAAIDSLCPEYRADGGHARHQGIPRRLGAAAAQRDGRSQKASVVSLALTTDSTLSKRGLIAADWQRRLPTIRCPIPPPSSSSSARESEGHPRLAGPDQR